MKYRVEYHDVKGWAKTTVVEADSEFEARYHCERSGYAPVSIKRVRQSLRLNSGVVRVLVFIGTIVVIAAIVGGVVNTYKVRGRRLESDANLRKAFDAATGFVLEELANPKGATVVPYGDPSVYVEYRRDRKWGTHLYGVVGFIDEPRKAGASLRRKYVCHMVRSADGEYECKKVVLDEPK